MLMASGDAAGEPLWRLPYDERYLDQVLMPDGVKNHPETDSGRAITAALFLGQFVPEGHAGLPRYHRSRVARPCQLTGGHRIRRAHPAVVVAVPLDPRQDRIRYDSVSCHAIPTLLNRRGPATTTRAPRTSSPRSASISSGVKRPSSIARTISPASRKAISRSSTTT